MNLKRIIKSILLTSSLIEILILFAYCSEPNENSGSLNLFHYIFNQSSPNPSCNAASCHNNAPMAEFPPTSGHHTKHLSNPNMDHTSGVCFNCHRDYYYNSQHRNGNLEGYDTIADVRTTGLVAYFGGNFGADSNSPVSAAFDPGTATCNTVSCHGGGSGFNWYKNLSTNEDEACKACHQPGSRIDPLVTNGTGLKGKHIAHVQSRGISCLRCHEDYRTKPSHMNRKYGKSGSPPETERFAYFGGDWPNPGDTVSVNFDDSANTCSSVSCHGGSATTMNWYQDGAGCVACHAPGSGIDPRETNDSGINGKHIPHVTNAGIECTTCHVDYKSQPTHMNGLFGISGGDPTANFINFDTEAVFPTGSAKLVVDPPGTPVWSDAANTCSSISCHGGSSTVFDWYTASVGCTACHAPGSSIDPLTTNGSGVDGKHIKHVTDRGISCETCHFDYRSKTTHMNGNYGQSGTPSEPSTTDFVDANSSAIFPDPGGNTVSFNFDTSNNTCNSLSCHGGGSNFEWYGTLSGCTACHTSGSAIDPTNTSTFPVNSHPKHVNIIGIACTECHNNYTTQSTHMDGSITTAVQNLAKISFTTTNPSGAYDSATQTCSTLMCHGNNLNAAALGTDQTPTWGTATSGACGTCHKTDTNGQGSHTKHLSAPYSFACDKCHNDGVADADHHSALPPANVVNVIFDSFNPGASFNSGTKDCSSLYCHGNLTDVTKRDGNDMIPTWGTASSGACGNCHDTDNLDTTAGTWKATGSHSTHFNSTGKGPGITACTDCHTSQILSSHVDKTVTFATEPIAANLNPTDLAGTLACDTCHSPLGDYNGVSDAVFGAKNNWALGVYDTSSPPLLKSGKEKWCVGCHDKSPPTIESTSGQGDGITAPNVGGDSTTAVAWKGANNGWGFFYTGHGRPALSGYLSGINKTCTDCHSPNIDHIDGVARTYTAASNNYVNGYRLKMNMTVPYNGWGYNTAAPAGTNNNFALCLSCHTDNTTSDPAPATAYDQFFRLTSDAPTNFVNAGSGFTDNKHHLHLSLTTSLRWDSDWKGGYDSDISCTACHNVHGSTQQAMIRDGALTGFSIDFTYTPAATTLLSASTGGTFVTATVCANCHNGPCATAGCGEISAGLKAKTYTRTPKATAP